MSSVEQEPSSVVMGNLKPTVLVDAFQAKSWSGDHAWAIHIEDAVLRIITIDGVAGEVDVQRGLDTSRPPSDVVADYLVSVIGTTWETGSMLHVRFSAPRSMYDGLMSSSLTLSHPSRPLNELFSRIGKAISELTL